MMKTTTHLYVYRETYSDPLISVIDPDVVSLPGDGGLRVASGGDTLHDGRLACCYHHIAGRLTEVVSQNWGKEEEETWL